MAARKKASSTKPARGGNARGKRFASGPDAEVEAFSSSARFDVRLLAQDIRGSVAHVKGLAKGGVLSADEAKALIRGLEEVGRDLASGTAALEPADEDVHMAVERLLTARIGELGGKLHTGRSRNDQVATDLRLWLRDEVDGLVEELRALDRALLDLAEAHVDTLLPGYTHLQRAQPVRLAHHLLAYHEMFERDRGRLLDLRKRMNRCPLGSAALAGTAFPIDRRYTARLLGFDGPALNSLDAVSDRDFVVELLAAASIAMTHLSRISEEIVLWSSSEFGFLGLPDSHATGSSIMPQKKNPDVAELTRGKTGRVVGSLVSLLTTLKSLPLAYNRDLQEDKEPLFDAVDTLRAAVRLLTSFLERVEVRVERMAEAASDPYLGMTELADAMARGGIPFREAHAAVGEIVRMCMDASRDPRTLSAAELKAIHPKLRVSWLETLDPERTVERRTEIGGTSRARVLEALARARKEARS